MRWCVSLYEYRFSFIDVSAFPNWYMVVRGQISGSRTQFYSYKCHIFVDKITTVVTTSVYIKKH